MLAIVRAVLRELTAIKQEVLRSQIALLVLREPTTASRDLQILVPALFANLEPSPKMPARPDAILAALVPSIRITDGPLAFLATQEGSLPARAQRIAAIAAQDLTIRAAVPAAASCAVRGHSTQMVDKPPVQPAVAATQGVTLLLLERVAAPYANLAPTILMLDRPAARHAFHAALARTTPTAARPAPLLAYAASKEHLTQTRHRAVFQPAFNAALELLPPPLG